MSNTTRQVVRPAFRGFLAGVAVVLVAGIAVLAWAAGTNGEADLWGLFTGRAEMTRLEFDFRLEASPWAWLIPAGGALLGAARGLAARRGPVTD